VKLRGTHHPVAVSFGFAAEVRTTVGIDSGPNEPDAVKIQRRRFLKQHLYLDQLV